MILFYYIMEAEVIVLDDYLNITVSGMITKNIPDKIMPKNIKKTCDEKRLKKVLINGLNLSGDYRTTERFNMAKEFSKHFMGNNIKISVITNKNLVFNDQIFETAAINRGVNIKVFIDKKKQVNGY